MTREQAVDLAKQCNARNNGVTYKPAKQHWRDGNHWYVSGSNGCGVFLA